MAGKTPFTDGAIDPLLEAAKQGKVDMHVFEAGSSYEDTAEHISADQIAIVNGELTMTQKDHSFIAIALISIGLLLLVPASIFYFIGNDFFGMTKSNIQNTLIYSSLIFLILGCGYGAFKHKG